MEIPDWSQKPLIREGADMEGDHHHHHHQHHLDHSCCSCSCCCGGRGGGRGGRGGGGIEAGYHRGYAPIPGWKETRLLRVAQLLVAGLLLLTAGSLALLFVVGLQGRCPPREDQQVREELSGRSVDGGGKPEMSKLLQGGGERPLAILTVPQERVLQGNRLNWGINVGALCRGGFNCTEWELVVPRDGFYRVFLQVTWRVPGHCTETSRPSIFKGDVIVFRDSYPSGVIALTMADSVECKNRVLKSLYASRILKLGPNSRLYVNSTFPNLISTDHNQVFFGAELID